MGKLAFVLSAVLGLVLGAGSALAWMTHGMVSHGGWSSSRVTGSVQADPWTRASVALTGLLALNRTQAIYFIRRTDDAGAQLVDRCRYRVSGGPLPARWWSVTVYAADNYLPRNNDAALSFDATRVQRDATGQWTAIAADRPQRGATWVSTRDAGRFDLTLRLYNPDAAAQADFDAIPMPHVQKIDCRAGAGA